MYKINNFTKHMRYYTKKKKKNSLTSIGNINQ